METTRRFARNPAPASILGALLDAWLATCGGGAAKDTPEPLPGTYVDAANGSDTTGDGSEGHPYKSIKRALQGAGPGDVVRVAPGTYDAANGEDFPIEPGRDVTIVGTEERVGFETLRLTNVVGGGLWSGDPNGRLHATIVSKADDHIVGLRIANPQASVVGGPIPAAVVMLSGTTLESCTLHHSDTGVSMIRGVTGTLIKGCTFVSNRIGISVLGAGSDNRVEGCLVTDNEAA